MKTSPQSYGHNPVTLEWNGSDDFDLWSTSSTSSSIKGNKIGESLLFTFGAIFCSSYSLPSSIFVSVPTFYPVLHSYRTPDILSTESYKQPGFYKVRGDIVSTKSQVLLRFCRKKLFKGNSFIEFLCSSLCMLRNLMTSVIHRKHHSFSLTVLIYFLP